MPTPIIDTLKDDSDLTMHTHTEADLGATLDSRYVNTTGDTMTGALTNTLATGNSLVWDTSTLIVDATNHRVGIGTTSPAVKLHLNVTDATGIKLASSDTSSTTSIIRGDNGASVFADDADYNGTSLVARDTSSSSINLVGGTIKLSTDTGLTSGNTFTATTRMHIGTDGFIGVGTEAPGAIFTVEKSSNATTYANGLPAVVVSNTNTTGSSFAAYKMQADNSGVVGEFFADGNDSFGIGSDSIYFRATTNHPMAFGTNNSVRMVISNTGNVGIGTTSPVTKLDLSYNSAIVSIGARFVNTATSGSTSGAGMVGLSDDGAAMASGDRLGYFLLGGSYDNSHTLTNTAGMSGFATEAWSATNKGTRLAFEGTPTGSATRAEWMTIKDGNVGIGTTSPSRKLSVSDDGTYSAYFSGRVGIGTNSPTRNLTITSAPSLSAGFDLVDGSSGQNWSFINGTSGSPVGAGNFAIYDTTTAQTRMVVSTSGNVGIGTTTPGGKLHIQGNDSTYIESVIENIKTTGNTAAGFAFKKATDAGSAAQEWKLGVNTYGDIRFRDETGSVNVFTIENGAGADAFYIKSGGNVGIGTTSPGGKLHINGTADDQQLIVEAHSTQTNNIVEIHDSSSNVLISFNGVGGAVFNEQGSATADFRVESDTEANMLFVDANANTDGSVYLGGTTNGIEIKKGGDLTLLGTAKYERHVQIPAMANGLPANQPAEVDFFTAGGLQFASAGAQYAYCQWEIPDDWDGTDVVFEVDWFPDSGAISGTDTIKWDVEYRSIAEGEAINNGTSVTVSVTDSTDYAQYITKHSRFTLTYNNANQPLVNQDHIYFKISRDTSVANDFAGTVTVAAYEIIYQSKGFPSSN